MNKLRHPAAAFIIVAVLAGLFVLVYDGLAEGYGITRGDTQGGEDVMQKLAGLNLVGGVNDIASGIEGIKSPANPADLLGALAAAGIGVLKVIGGIITFVPEILGIITNFYYVPPIVTTGIGALIILYVGFLILSAYLNRDI